MNKKAVITFTLLGLVVGLIIGYSVSLILPSQTAAAQTPSITLSQSTVAAGGNYTATVTGFAPNTKIYGWTVNQDPPSCFIAGTTDSNGQLILSACAPASAGSWPLVACDESQTHWAVTSMTVTR